MMWLPLIFLYWFNFDFRGLCCIIISMVLQEQSEVALQFKIKQIIIAVFLLLFVLTTTGFLLYFSYGLMKDGNSNENVMMGNSPIKMPVLNLSKIASLEKHSDQDHFLYGEFSAEDGKYKLYKVHYKEFSKEEIFSFLWSDTNSQPAIAVHQEHIAVFPTVGGGFFIHHDGRIAEADEFIPPLRYFSISPDGKMMLYFKYLSSLGNPMLVLRDLIKNQDVHSWPLNSSASEICDFVGWSPDETEAYCLYKKNNTAKVKKFNIKTHQYSVIASADDVIDAKYYPEHSIFLIGAQDGVMMINTANNEKSRIVSAPENTTVKNVFLAPDGRRVLYTATLVGDIIYGDKIYSVNIDGNDQKELMKGQNANLISLSPNAKDILFESPDKNNHKIEHYFIADVISEHTAELYMTNVNMLDTQFIGWFQDEPAGKE